MFLFKRSRSKSLIIISALDFVIEMKCTVYRVHCVLTKIESHFRHILHHVDILYTTVFFYVGGVV